VLIPLPDGSNLQWLQPPRPSLGPAVGTFCAANVRHTKGRWGALRDASGKVVRQAQALIFEPWQQAFLNEAFEVNPETGLRVYSEVLLGIPRKNGKSTMAAGISLYLLVADGEAGPEVYNAAGARDQARVVFQQAREFVEASPTLSDVLLPKRYEIDCPENAGHLRVISSKANLQHGSNPSGNVIDELWAHADDALYVALTSGTAAREQTFTLTCTTAGFDEESPLGQLYGKALALEVEQPTPFLTIARDRETGFLMYWYGVPEDRAYAVHDPAVVKQANPASWVTEQYLASEMRKPGTRFIEYRRWHANQWTASEEAWIEGSLWDACKDEAVQLTPALPAGVGVDMGEVYDSTGRVVAQRQPCPHLEHEPEACPGDRVVVRARRWANPYPAGHTLRDAWRVNTEDVREDLRAVHALYPVPMARRDKRIAPGPAFGYDPWQFRESAQLLEDDGLNMVEVPQNASRMGPASELLLELVRSRRLVHDGDPQLRQAITAAVAKRTPRGWVMTKPKGSTKLIDLAVACAVGVHMAMLEAPKARARKPRPATGF
jgi:phage terminase large subunit-like protein